MTCDIWETDYNSDNLEPEFMTIFVTWQLIVTLDSIRNSCDVYNNQCLKLETASWSCYDSSLKILLQASTNQRQWK